MGEEAFLTFEQTAENEGLFDGEVWVGVDEGEVVGFVAVDGHEVTWLYVDPDKGRRGYGRALLRHAIARGGIEVEVLQGNEPASSLYESEGFVITETRTGKLAGNEGFPATGHTMVLRPAEVR